MQHMSVYASDQGCHLENVRKNRFDGVGTHFCLSDCCKFWISDIEAICIMCVRLCYESLLEMIVRSHLGCFSYTRPQLFSNLSVSQTLWT